MARANNTKLAPGEDSISRVTAFPRGKGVAIHWRARLADGRDAEGTHRGKNDGAARRNARKALEKIAQKQTDEGWTLSSPVADYMKKYTLSGIKTARLTKTTTTRYELAYRLLLGKCSLGHTHQHSLAGLTLGEAMRRRKLKQCLEEIGALHGESNMFHGRTVAKKYLAGPLLIDELIEVNPVFGLDLDRTVCLKPKYSRGGRALTVPEYRSTLDYLLKLDPALGVPVRRQGRFSYEDRVNLRRQRIDVILLQATTGMRISEMCKTPIENCDVDPDGTFRVYLDGPAVVKTNKSRSVPVIVPLVSKRMAEHLARARAQGIPGRQLFPSPSVPEHEWNQSNRDKALALLYKRIAEDLKVPMFYDERGHSWRTTLNTLLHEVEESVRIELLGHTVDVNRKHYVAQVNTASLMEHGKILWEDKPSKSPQKSPKTP